MIPLRTSDSIGTSETPWDFLSGDLLRDGRNLRLVMETVGELYGQIDPEERMRRAVDRAIHVTEAQRGFLLIDQDGVLRTRVARDARGRDLPLGDRYSRSIVQRVWATGEPAKEAWEPGDRPIGLGQSIPSLQLESIMAMRLAYEGRPLGVLYIDATSTTKDFTHSEHKVFLALGGLVATALENGRLEAESVHQRASRAAYS